MIFDFFNQGWVGSFIGAIGILIGFIFHRKSKIGSRLVCQLNSFTLIGKNNSTSDEIEIFYKGSKVPRVVKTNIILWNSGDKTIYGSNIVEKDPLRVEVDLDEAIISVNVLKVTQDANEVSVFLDNNQRNIACIDFNYLDASDGMVVEILHTDSRIYPEVKGVIRGLPKGAMQTKLGYDFGDLSGSNRKMITKPVLIGATISGLFGVGVFIFSRIPQYKLILDKVLTISNSLEPLYYAFLIIGIIYIIPSIYLLILTRRKYPKELNLTGIQEIQEQKK